MNHDDNLLNAALDYAREYGAHVFPLHTVRDGGVCSCGKIDCNSAGKHPRTSNGVTGATRDESQIREWWATWPDANIGIATGHGVLVLDIDGPEGEASLAKLEAKHGPLPECPEVETGGGGRHLWMSTPDDQKIRNSASQLGEKLDIRAEGGYVVAPPSRHASGKSYRWRNGEMPSTSPLPEAPHWLIRRITGRNKTPRALPDTIPEPTRNVRFASLAGSMRYKGADANEIEAALQVMNQQRSDPPLDEKEVRKIAESIGSYPPGNMDEVQMEQTIRDAMPRFESKDRSILRDQELIGALFWSRSQAPDLYVEAKQNYKGLVRELEKAVKRYRLKVVTDETQVPTLKELLEHLGMKPPPDLADELIMPVHYTWDAQGTVLLTATDGYPYRQTICPSYVFISRRIREVSTGEVSLEICHTNGNGWHHIVAKQGEFTEARRLVRLADKGLMVGSHSAGHFAKYLFDFLKANHDVLPLTKVSSQLGWMGEASFLWGTELLGTGDVSFHGSDSGDTDIAEGFRSKGTLEKWLEVIKPAMDYPRARVALFASLTSPILKILGIDNIGVDFTARTSTGKTTLLTLAASVWGATEMRGNGSLLNTWDTTKVAIERTCAVANDLPTILDDTKRGNKHQIGDIIYEIMSGKGKLRGSLKGLRQTVHWRTVLISSGEAPACSYGQEGGIRARILTIRGLPFGADNEATKRVVDNLNHGLSNHYGHAGPPLIKSLIENQEKWPEIRSQYEETREKLAEQSSGVGFRLAAAAAVIITAGQIAHEALDLPWEFENPFDELWDTIQADVNQADVDIRALEDVVSWAHSHESEFFGRHASDGKGNPKQPPLGWAGRWDKEDNWEFIAFYPTKLKEILAPLNYEYEAAVGGWKERGWLESAGNGYTCVKKIEGKSSRLVVIKRQPIDQVVFGESGLKIFSIGSGNPGEEIEESPNSEKGGPEDQHTDPLGESPEFDDIPF